MPRIGLLNILIGFTVLFFAAAAGSLVAFDMTNAFLFHKESLGTWELTLQRSAHGHTNLFAMLHVLFGLTLPYSRLSLKVKQWQTAGFLSGTVAMGPLMIVRSFLGPTESLDWSTLAMGGLLTLALVAIASHASAIALRVMRAD